MVKDYTVYPKKYAHGYCFAVLCYGYTLTDFPISIRLTSLALWQSNDCPSASKATLMNMDKYFMWIHYERLHNHNKAKHNKTVCIFFGIYCMVKDYICVSRVYDYSNHVCVVLRCCSARRSRLEVHLHYRLQAAANGFADVLVCGQMWNSQLYIYMYFKRIYYFTELYSALTYASKTLTNSKFVMAISDFVFSLYLLTVFNVFVHFGWKLLNGFIHVLLDVIFRHAWQAFSKKYMHVMQVLFLSVELANAISGSGYGFTLNRQPVVSWIKGNSLPWRLCTSPGLRDIMNERHHYG